MKLSNVQLPKTDLFVELEVNHELEEYWNERITPTKENLYPLAPSELKRLGLITRQNYDQQNGVFGKGVSQILFSELDTLLGELIQLYPYLTQRQLRQTIKDLDLSIVVLGGGLGRDLGWIARAQDFPLEVEVLDNSSSACEKVRQLCSKEKIKGVKILHGEAAANWDEVVKTGTVGIYASQFLQRQTPEQMRIFMKKLAAFLYEDREPNLPKRRVWLVHPLPEDNSGPKIWDGLEFPSVRWRDTIAYSLKELEAPAAEAGMPLNFRILGQSPYYHQTYSVFRADEQEPGFLEAA